MIDGQPRAHMLAVSCCQVVYAGWFRVVCYPSFNVQRKKYEEEQILMWILKCNKNDYLNESNVCFMTFMAIVDVH